MLPVEPPETGSSKESISDALEIGIPVTAILTALIVCIYCIKKRRKSLMHKGTIVKLISNFMLCNKQVEYLSLWLLGNKAVQFGSKALHIYMGVKKPYLSI